MKFLIAYNDNTEDLAGGFFAYCGEEIIEETENHHIDSVVLTSPSLTNTLLVQHLSDCQVCVIANHGDARSIDGDNENIVSVDTNNRVFFGKLLYAISCTCAQELKDSLASEGLRSFWGYDNELHIWYGYPQYARCALAGIKSLMAGNKVKDAKEQVIAQYNADIAELEEQYPDHPELAAALLDNREALVIFGDDELKLSDL